MKFLSKALCRWPAPLIYNSFERLRKSSSERSRWPKLPIRRITESLKRIISQWGWPATILSNTFKFIILIIFGFFFTISNFAFSVTNNYLIKEWKLIDTKILKISAKETEIINQKLNIELALSETSENIKTLTDIIFEKRNLITNRIRYLNQDSGSDLLRNLLESNNPGELERNYHFLLIATSLDIDIIRQYNRDIIKLEKEQQKYSLRISKLNELQRELKIQSDIFFSELKNKGVILNKIRRRLKSNSKMWAEELKRALSNHNDDKYHFYQSLLNKNFMDRKGQLTSPTDSNIHYSFGPLKLNPLTPAIPFHGLLFESPIGTPVRAMTDGTVSWIGQIQHLGSTIILDHGRDLHSVYSRVQLAKLKIGDMIEEGSIIGKVEPSQSRLGKGLYFEVREGTLPSDPLLWILTKSELFKTESDQWENVQ